MGTVTKVYDSFDDVEDQWLQAQAGGSCYGFQCLDWLKTWYNHIGQYLNVRPVFVVTTDDRNRPWMLSPFSIRTVNGSRVLSWLGGDETDFHAPLLGPAYDHDCDAAAFQVLWRQTIRLLPRVDVVHFDKQPECIGDFANPFMHLPVRHHAMNHTVALAEPWMVFRDRRLPAKARADSRRRRRRLEEKGAVSFRIAASAAEADTITATMIRQKSRRYIQTGVLDMFTVSPFRRFYRSLAEQYAASGRIHVSALYCGNDMVATHWGMVHRDRFYHIMPAYDADGYGRFAPGRLLLEQLMEWCCNKGLRVFDFTVGDEGYKRLWCDTTYPLYEYIEAVRDRGRLYVLRNDVVNKIREAPALHRVITRLRNKRAQNTRRDG